jgi:hypothetical protein
MGVFFSRASGHFQTSIGGYIAGDFNSATAQNIAPFLGRNTGTYDGLNKTTLPPIPYEWIISPSTVEASQCPSNATMLFAFGLADLATAVLAMIFACQPVVRALSFHKLGNRSTTAIKWTWCIHLSFHLLGNAVVAALIGRTPGYGNLNMLHIFTLMTARPRANLVLLGILRSLVRVKFQRSSRDKTPRRRHTSQDQDEFFYADAYIAAVCAEFILVLIAAIFTGVTWNRMPIESDTRGYIGSVVQFVEANPGFVVFVMVALLPIYRRYGEAFPMRGWGASRFRSWDTRVVQNSSVKSIWAHRVGSALLATLFLGFVYMIQWDYFVQFLELPGVL